MIRRAYLSFAQAGLSIQSCAWRTVRNSAARRAFLQVVENERIVWTSALQGGWRPNKDDMPFSAIITLEDHPEGMKYTATALHQNDEDRWKHADMGYVDGWGMCIEQLGKLAEQLA